MEIDVLKITLAQDCSFVLFQYVSIFKIDKNFTRKEISSKIIPFYYYATLFWIPFVYTTVIAIDVYWFLLLMTIQPLVVLLLSFFAPKYRLEEGKNKSTKGKQTFVNQLLSLNMCRMAYIIGSFSELMRQLQRIVITTSREGAKGSDSVLLKLQSEVIRSFSAWIAQDLFTTTEQFGEIYFLSILLNGILILVATAGDHKASGSKDISLKKIFKGVKEGFKELTAKQSVNIAASITNTALRLFLGLFNNSILLEIHARKAEELQKKEERKNLEKTLEEEMKSDRTDENKADENNNSLNLNGENSNSFNLNEENSNNEKDNTIVFKTSELTFDQEIKKESLEKKNKPKTIKEMLYIMLEKVNFAFGFLINCITRCILFVSRTPAVKKKKGYLGIGYIVGIVKLLAICLAWAISVSLEKCGVNGYYGMFFSFPIIFCSFLCFANAKSVFVANVFFLTTSCIIGVTDGFLKATQIKVKNKELITCFSLFMVGATSSVINAVCSFFNVGIKTKSNGFIGLSFCVYLLCLLVNFIKVRE